MKGDRISQRQILVILTAALIAPMAQGVPAWTAAIAGEGAWVTGLVVFLPLLGMGWLYGQLLEEDGGLGEAYQRTLGKGLGNIFLVPYLLWGLFLLIQTFHGLGHRMETAGYAPGNSLLVLLPVVVLVAWMGWGRLSAFARAVEIFYFILIVAVAVVVFFSLLDMKPTGVLPLWTEDIPAILAASVIPLGIAGLGAFAACAGKRVKQEGGRWPWRLAFSCLGVVVLHIAILGQLGAALTARIPLPFFEVAKGVGIEGAFQRTEAAIVALWVLSDFALLGLVVFGCRGLIRAMVGEEVAWIGAVLPVLALVGAQFWGEDNLSGEKMSMEPVILGNLILGFGVPIVVYLVKIVRKRKPKPKTN